MPERAARYFNSFNPHRPMMDLSEEEWIKLGTLYDVRPTAEADHILNLRFLPDTNDQDADALLLLLYGYQRIYREDEVSAKKLEEGLWLSGCRKKTAVVGLGAVENPRLEVDAVAKSLRLVGLVSPKLGLAKGGYYRLTAPGNNTANALFDDLIRRA